MLGRTVTMFGLALLGILKAGATVALGVALHAPPLLVSAAAALWITGPPTAAWALARARRAAAR